jgi:hypothetical protein
MILVFVRKQIKSSEIRIPENSSFCLHTAGKSRNLMNTQ